ncbi:MAG: hypothetical protein ABI772_03530 [Bacteroidota bacterium]
MLRELIYNIRINRTHGASLSQLKHYFRWKKSFRPAASSVVDEQPWITFDAIDKLKELIRPDFKVFEYGGGGSTFFFVKRCNEVITAEHNDIWFKILTQKLEGKTKGKWKGHLIEAEQGDRVVNPDKANPDHYSSDDIPSKGTNYFKYASAIDQFADNYFDIVLVDGRSRPSCMKHSIPKLKSGGYLVLDNSDRDYYLPFFKDVLSQKFTLILNNTGPTPYCREFTQTSIWKKN